MGGVKVYLVRWDDWDDVGTVGVYTTEAAAEAAVEACSVINPHLPYTVDEIELDAAPVTPRPPIGGRP